MNKTELVRAIAKTTKHDEKVVSDVIGAFVEITMKRVAKNDPVRLVGFGTFAKHRRAAKTYYNFEGKAIKKKETTIPYFSAGEIFKREVRKKR